MNKYQDALNKIIRACCPYCYDDNGCQNCEIKQRCNATAKSWVDTLQELVDEKTPMKAIVYNINQFKCPRCNKQIKGRLMLYNMETRKHDIKCKTKVEKIYCPYCSQKLDWGDECD
jgi:hypothetical protein